MEYKIDRIKDITILKIKGKLDSSSYTDLQEYIIPEAEKKGIKMVIDMKEMDYISSSGIRVLLAVKKIKNNRGKLVLAEVNPNVLSVLNMADVPSVIPVLTHLDEILEFMK